MYIFVKIVIINYLSILLVIFFIDYRYRGLSYMLRIEKNLNTECFKNFFIQSDETYFSTKF